MLVFKVVQIHFDNTQKLVWVFLGNRAEVLRLAVIVKLLTRMSNATISILDGFWKGFDHREAILRYSLIVMEFFELFKDLLMAHGNQKESSCQNISQEI